MKARFGKEVGVDLISDVSPSSRYIICSDDDLYKIMSIKSGEVVGQIEHEGFPRFGHDGQKIFLGGNGPTIPIYGAKSQERIGGLTDPSARLDISSEAQVDARPRFGPHGKYVVVLYWASYPSRTVEVPVIWERVKEDSEALAYEIRRVLPRQEGINRDVHFGPSGQYVMLSDGTSESVSVYRLGKFDALAGGRKIMTLPGHEGGVVEAVWLYNGSKILTRDEVGTLRIWPFFDNPQALIDSARTLVKQAHPRSTLTPDQREKFYLSGESKR
jgi:hypothetical protein